MHGRFKSFLVASSVFIAVSLPLAAQALPSYSNLFVFGDSLADSGNNALISDTYYGGARTPTPTDPIQPLIPSAPYVSNRYSNGPVWVEQLADKLGLAALPSLAGGTNYAYGGARLGTSGVGLPPSLIDQVSAYLGTTENMASASALYVVEGGGNDARDIFATAAGGGEYESLITAYAGNVASIITSLANAGAQNILLWNVPDIGKIPAIQAIGGGAPALATTLVGAMNSALDAALATLPMPWLDGLHRFDAFAAFNALYANPGAYGFSDVSNACSASADCIASPDVTFFWDGIHPTTAGHALLAELSAAAIPEPASLLLVMLALILLFGGRFHVLRHAPRIAVRIRS